MHNKCILTVSFLVLLKLLLLPTHSFAWNLGESQKKIEIQSSQDPLCGHPDVDKHIQFFFNTNLPTENCLRYFRLKSDLHPYLTPVRAWKSENSKDIFVWYEGQGFLVDKERFDTLYKLFRTLKEGNPYKETVNHENFFYRLKSSSNLLEDINRVKIYFNKFQNDTRFREVLEFEGYYKNGEYVLGNNMPKVNISISQDEFTALFILKSGFRKFVKDLYEKYKDAYVINGVVKPALSNIAMSRVSVFVDGSATKEIKCDNNKCVFRHVSLKERYSVKINGDCFTEYSNNLKDQYPLIKLKPMPISIISEKQTIIAGEKLWLKAFIDCKEIKRDRFHWTANNKTFGNNSDKVEFTANDSGNYNITVSIPDDNGKVLFEGKQVVSVLERLTIGISGPSELAINEEGLFSISLKTGALQKDVVKYSYSWTVDNKRYSGNNSTIRLRFDTSGKYSIKLDFWQWIQRENRWQKIDESVHYVIVKPILYEPNPTPTKSPIPAATPTNTPTMKSSVPSSPSQFRDFESLNHEDKMKVLNCICRCSSTGGLNLSVFYATKPIYASSSCSDLSKGPCVNQGSECWRHFPITSGKCFDNCLTIHLLKSLPSGYLNVGRQ